MATSSAASSSSFSVDPITLTEIAYPLELIDMLPHDPSSSASSEVAVVTVTRSRHRQGHAKLPLSGSSEAAAVVRVTHPLFTQEQPSAPTISHLSTRFTSPIQSSPLPPSDRNQFLSHLSLSSVGYSYCFSKLFGERMIDKDFRPSGFAEYMVKDMGMSVDVVEKSENNNKNGVAWCCIGQEVVFGYGG
ncbi:hypothetical protein Ddye_025746 [Dipteronia dyeriana]|uniref:Uncharacterized protein n=1 Tax=Dipteronia dyeriana TaxID=168575 RepID=A0AAD9WNT7_9ROSI|nr:hypothetical protein Ddye_025746 [Dipteronia dyeriana]